VGTSPPYSSKMLHTVLNGLNVKSATKLQQVNGLKRSAGTPLLSVELRLEIPDLPFVKPC